MSEKDWKIERLNEDLQAGRVMLPQTEWMREYLGEWVGPTPGPFAKLTKTPRPTGASFQYVTVATTKCALCSVLFTADADEQFIAAHAKVCEKRPLAVGDYMRLDCSRDGSDWVEGPIVTLRGTDGHAAISPERASVRMSHRIHGNPFTFAVVASLGIRRIPRPAAEVRAVLNERDGAMYYGDIRLTDGKPPTIETPWISTTKCLPLDPLDTKYDGVTLRTLIDGDAFNRQEQGGAMWRAKPMTPVQRAAVSAHWSAELRAKLAASKERERLQVVVDDGEVGPWW